jgi:hypothetical protein
LRFCVVSVAARYRSGAGRRTEKRNWLSAHDYTVLGIFDRDVESDMAAALARIEDAIGKN